MIAGSYDVDLFGHFLCSYLFLKEIDIVRYDTIQEKKPKKIIEPQAQAQAAAHASNNKSSRQDEHKEYSPLAYPPQHRPRSGLLFWISVAT